MTSPPTAILNLLKGQNILGLLQFLKLSAYLWPLPAAVKDGACYDFIVVGGGTAGCIIASRLAELKAKVLLIEAGDQPPLETQMAGMFAYSKGSQYDWNFTTPYDENAYRYHRNGVADIYQGKILGGSNQVNYMFYSKGVPSDYNKWAEITKDCSWMFRNLCKIFKKVEKVEDEVVLNSADMFFHGTEGKIQIKKYHDPKHADYFEAYREMGLKTVLDINPNNTLGFTSAFFNIYNRIRRSTAYSYLSPEKKNPNLSVMYNALATKIIFDKNKKAVGVEILTQNGTTITAKADKEVIVSAGVIKSPHLLMVSGIGPATLLKKHGIGVISNLSQVGQNFQDNPNCILVYKMGKSEPDFPANPNEFSVTGMEGYVSLNDCPDHADYQVLSGIINNSEFFAQVCAFVFPYKYEICNAMAEAGKGRQLHYVTNLLLYPESRGEIILKSKDPKEYPIILPKYYSTENDVINHARYLKHYNKVLKTKFFKSVNAELIYPPLETCDTIRKDTMEYWKCYVKAMGSSLHMYFGTCRMGSVVDSKLRVIGVKNLRVADASVIPVVGSTLQATVMMIAEKLILMLAEDYDLTIE